MHIVNMITGIAGTVYKRQIDVWMVDQNAQHLAARVSGAAYNTC
jgi:hypothetical protein